MIKQTSLIVCLALVGAYCCSAETTIDELVAKLDADVQKLDVQFKETTDSVFRNKFRLADELAKKNADRSVGLKAIALKAMGIEMTGYAIRRKVATSLREFLQRFRSQPLDGSVRFARNAHLVAEFVELLIVRAKLRADVECFERTASQWQLMYLYWNHYLAAGSELKEFAGELFEHLIGQRNAVDQAHAAQQLAEGAYEQAVELDAEGAASLVAVVDELIDEAVGCSSCAYEAEPDEENYSTYSMFASESDVAELVLGSVEGSLLADIRTGERSIAGKAPSFSFDRIEQVELGEIDEFAERYLLN